MAASKVRADSLQLQDRDLDLLRGLFECRVMTTDHATALYFEGNYESAKKRLQKLKTAGLITERPRRAFDPSVLFLTRKGLMLLQEKGVLSKYPSFGLPALDRRARVSDLTIRHELEIMDVKVAFLSKRISRTITPAELEDISRFEASQLETFPNCKVRVRSQFMPGQIAHDIEKYQPKKTEP